MRVWVLKTIILVSLFILTYIFSLLPIKLMSLARHATDIRRKHKIERLIRYDNGTILYQLHQTWRPQYSNNPSLSARCCTLFNLVSLERLRYEWYAKTVCSNRRPNVTVMRGEVKIPSFSVTVNETL